MWFEIIGEVTDVQVIATGRSIREAGRLIKIYGKGRWRKLKGIATVRLLNKSCCKAEIHWYEAHGVGKKEFKIKQLF